MHESIQELLLEVLLDILLLCIVRPVAALLDDILDKDSDFIKFNMRF